MTSTAGTTIPPQTPTATTPTTTPTPTPTTTALTPATAPAPAPAPLSTPAPTTALLPIPTPAPAIAPESIPAPIVEISDSLDPLSHLSHIFEKIRKQVIEWGEDANWKIDVFLLPNEDGTIASGTAPSAPAPTPVSTTLNPPIGTSTSEITPAGSSSTSTALVLSSRTELSGSPQVIEIDSDVGSGSPRFALQPPPNDLPSSTGEGIPASLKEQDVASMSETEAKQMLTLAIRQIRGQLESLSQATQDLESMQRERDAEARLDVEKRIMERDAAILSKKWKDAEHVLREKEREIRDVQMQLERGKQYIRDRNEERRKRIAENGGLMRSPSGREGLGLAQSPVTPTKADPSPQFHSHRHRHIHHHRHHHRHLLKHPELGNDSLENLAILATQVLMREPLVISKRVLNDHKSIDNVALGNNEYAPRSDKKRTATEERDQGLQLRPVKRIDLNGLDSEESKKDISLKQSSSSGQKAISNSRISMDLVGRRQTQRSSQSQQSPVYQQVNPGSSSTTPKASPKDLTVKPLRKA
ncbi:hypothetical protein BGZ46_009634 [Entomortierella lignicola]|nr:hypothetical protein BGZ46_009634 [Entomortierella lignicola]